MLDHSHTLLSGKRYRFCFFDYRHDFSGRFNYEGPKSGYARSKDKFTFSGWVLPAAGEGPQNLQLHIVHNGDVIDTLEVLPQTSHDVQARFADNPYAAQARFKLNLSLSFLEHDEYILRFYHQPKDRRPQRLWDLAFIKDSVEIQPVFVVGSPRAGTTALGNALRQGLDAKNYGEHHFQFLAKIIEEATSNYFRRYHTRNDVGTFIHDMSSSLVWAKFGQQIKELYERWQRKPYFVDKTPGRNMIASIPTILTIWPEAKFIFCKRRSYENVKSRLVKFPHLTIEQHSMQWVEVMQNWRLIRERILEEHRAEVDQHDMQNDPRSVGACIQRLFGPEKSEKVMARLLSIAPERTAQKNRLDREDLRLIKRICQDEMVEWGYSCDVERYYK